MAPVRDLSLVLNGRKYVVRDADPKMTLSQWIREQAGATGTKVMCGEGVCGSCVVVLTKRDPLLDKDVDVSVNSCIFPLCAADGCSITTAEGIGGKGSGLAPVQQRMTDYHGTQCGFCTPGMITAMHSFLSNNPNASEKEMETALDGNLCRCTGYRPICDALKSLASEPHDIEDLPKCKSQGGDGSCHLSGVITSPSPVTSSSVLWYKPQSLAQVQEILDKHKDDSVQLVAGNTGKAYLKYSDSADVRVYIKDVPELSEVKINDNHLSLGASVTMTQAMRVFEEHSEDQPALRVLSNHLSKIGSTHVRNVGTLGGSLMLKHRLPNFNSDVFLVLSTIGATLTICPERKEYAMEEFICSDMTRKCILAINIPLFGKKTTIWTHKVMGRRQNASPIVNVGFAVTLETEELVVAEKPRLLFGGLQDELVHASQTADFLVGKTLLDPNTLKDGLKILEQELQPTSSTVLQPSAAYRKSASLALFYKFYLGLLGDRVPASIQSAALPLERPLTSSSQSFPTNPERFPETQDIPRIASNPQVTGHAEYSADVPKMDSELVGAFVLSKQGNCKLAGLDFTEAMKMPGVLGYLTAEDIIGQNTAELSCTMVEEVFCSEEVLYAGQSLALILAETQAQADAAVERVKVTYKDIKKPTLTIQDALENNTFKPTSPRKPTVFGDPEGRFEECDHVISGEVSNSAQHHFALENQVAVAVPCEDEINIYTSVQNPINIRSAVSQALGISCNRINMHVKRLGGGFGGKLSKASTTAIVSALAAMKYQRPVRVVMNLMTNMKMVGKRCPMLTKYKVGFSSSGLLEAVSMECFVDVGCTESAVFLYIVTSAWVSGAYFCPNWKLSPVVCFTNTAPNTFCRAPGVMEGYAVIETVLAHIASVLGKPTEEIQALNLIKNGQSTFYGQIIQTSNMEQVWEELMETSEFERRRAEVQKFNECNKWRKRGISVTPIVSGKGFSGNKHTVQVSIHERDGTVSVAHGGINMGQGINTRIAQVVASGIGLSTSMITVKLNSSLVTPNDCGSFGSASSEGTCLAALGCCKLINRRLAPIRKQKPDASWKDLIEHAYKQGVDLVVRHYHVSNTGKLGYGSMVTAASCSEVEVDILTGEAVILRSDLLFDCGQSTNPMVDIGQIEGSYVMNIGFCMSEEVLYDPETGDELTWSTLDYKVPTAQDIPADFRVSLLKNSTNPLNVLGSKAIGEPAICSATSCAVAVRQALESSRKERGKPNSETVASEFPLTVARRLQLLDLQTEDFIL